jgi:uncharacterized protein (TIGR04222 family)
MIPTGDTWGISGPTFLLAYLVLAVAVGVAVLRTRRALAGVSAERPASRMEDRPYDVAYLNGGAPLAVTAALSAMYRAGTSALRDGESSSRDSGRSRGRTSWNGRSTTPRGRGRCRGTPWRRSAQSHRRCTGSSSG